MPKGCTDSVAVNYQSEAYIENEPSTCLIYGCTDSTGLNFSPTANFGTPSEYCDEAYPGCLDSRAQNYCTACNVDASSGQYSCQFFGCSDSTYFNYDPIVNFLVQIGPSSCLPFVDGCITPSGSNYDSLANTDDGSCVPYPAQPPHAPPQAPPQATPPEGLPLWAIIVMSTVIPVVVLGAAAGGFWYYKTHRVASVLVEPLVADRSVVQPPPLPS